MLRIKAVVFILAAVVLGACHRKVADRPLPSPAAAVAPMADPSPATGATTYSVRPGDCLWRIAGRHLESPFQWPVIWKANRDFIVEPDWIEAGDTLDIPGPPEGEDGDWAAEVAARWPQAGRMRGHRAWKP